jgi:hypothetical protein
MVKAECSYLTLANTYQTTECHIQADSIIHNHHHEKLKSQRHIFINYNEERNINGTCNKHWNIPSKKFGPKSSKELDTDVNYGDVDNVKGDSEVKDKMVMLSYLWI